MRQLKTKKNRAILIITLMTVVAIFFASIVNTMKEKKSHGTPDLRNRIIGSRIIKHKEATSPYFYKWNKHDGDQFLDPYDTPGLPMNRNTVTPFTLQLLQPICDIKYKDLTVIWFIIEIIALLVTALQLAYLSAGLTTKLIVLSISLIGIGISQGWILHNLSGQVYIFVPFLLSSLLYTSRFPTRINDFFFGLVLSILILFRPNTLLFVLPFFLLKKWKLLFYVFSLIAMYFGLLYLNDEIWLWRDYFRAVNLWGGVSASHGDTRSYMELLNIKVIEGDPFISQPPQLIFLEDSSILGLFRRFLITTLTRAQLSIIMLCSFGALLFLLRNKIRHYNLDKLFVLTFLLYFFSELCIPAIRNSYNAVQWVFPLAVLYLDGKRTNVINVIILIGSTFAVGLLKFFPFDLFISELLFSIAAIAYLTKNITENA